MNSSLISSLDSYCMNCSLKWKAQFHPRALEATLVNDLLKGKDTASQAAALFMLTFYTDNILQGSGKPINAVNQKLQQHIGVSENSLKIFEHIGYKLEGNFLQPQGMDKANVVKILVELSLLRLAVGKIILQFLLRKFFKSYSLCFL
jgi:hypothetical protein